jgi:hypothetical protein
VTPCRNRHDQSPAQRRGFAFLEHLRSMRRHAIAPTHHPIARPVISIRFFAGLRVARPHMRVRVIEDHTHSLVPGFRMHMQAQRAIGNVLAPIVARFIRSFDVSGGRKSRRLGPSPLPSGARANRPR